MYQSVRGVSLCFGDAALECVSESNGILHLGAIVTWS